MFSTIFAALPWICAVAAPSDGWSLATADTRITMGVVANRPVIRQVEDSSASHQWLDSPSPIALIPEVSTGDTAHPLHWQFVDGTQSDDSTTLTLLFQNADPKLQLRSVWRARPGRGPVEHWITIENQSPDPVVLPFQASLAVSGLIPGEGSAVWWIKRGGSNASTQGGTFTEPVNEKLDVKLLSNCDDGASPVPWLAVQQGTQHGLYIGWEFSGQGLVTAKAHSGANTLDLQAGLLQDFKTDIAPGEVFGVPPAFIGCYAGDIDDGAYALHQWILRYLRPRVAEGIPDPILAYNLYLDAGGPNARETDVLRSAEFCRDLGFEAFMPDAMWFPACGDWRWDPARFPSGVTPIEQFVHQSGMRLALWCAWTNGGIAEDPGALSARGPAAHPDWFDSDFAGDWKPGPFYGARVCLASPEAKAWELNKTQWLVGNHKLDYLKHDCGPIVNQCNKTTHRHHFGTDASYWATMGYYEVQEELRKAFPNVILENCSGGGHIKDFGIIQRTHYTVTTDTLSNLPDRQSIYDSTYAFPPMLLQAYTYEWEYKVPGDDPGSYLWRSAMMGAWQIDPTNTRKWTDEDKLSAQRDAQIYKDWVRPILQDVKVHHVLPRPDGTHWDGLFYWSPSLKRGTLYVFRPNAEEDERTITLKGLEPQVRYWVWCEDGSVLPGERSGAELMEQGIEVALPRRYCCDLVYVQDASTGKPPAFQVPNSFQTKDVKVEADAFHISATLVWTEADHARNYHVVVAKDAEMQSVLADKTVIANRTTISGLAPETDYYYSVVANAAGGKRTLDGIPWKFTTQALLPLPNVTFLSDMEWAHATAGANNTVHRDANYGGKEISVGGKVYPKGIWTHAFDNAVPADLTVSIAEKGFGRFVADAGVEDSAGAGSVQFQVLVDAVAKAESPVMKPRGVHHFDVDIAGAKELTLRVLNGGDGYACDHAAWGNARLVKQGAADPLAQHP